MAGETVEPRLLRLFADLLDYPRPGLLEVVRECEASVSDQNPEAAALLRDFRAFAEERSLGELEELYTGAFDLDTLSDLDATCYPYVGHHLFGESYKRSAFLLELSARFRAHGFAVENELPDHLAVLLRFVATCDDPTLVEELVHDALVPALERMAGEVDETEERPEPRRGRDHYQQVLRALRLFLQAQTPPVTVR